MTSKKPINSAEKAETRRDAPASDLIDTTLENPGDWRGQMLGRIRVLIRQAAPDIMEEVKWRKPSNPDGVPVWSSGGMICTGETYKDKVKLIFAKGARLDDPARLFNASLNGGTRRTIRAAFALNAAG